MFDTSLIEKGDKISLENAEVVSLKTKTSCFNGNYVTSMGVLVVDPTFGKVWFKSAAQFVWDLNHGDTLSCGVTVSGVGPEGDIIFSKRPVKATIEAAADKVDQVTEIFDGERSE